MPTACRPAFSEGVLISWLLCRAHLCGLVGCRASLSQSLLPKMSVCASGWVLGATNWLTPLIRCGDIGCGIPDMANGIAPTRRPPVQAGESDPAAVVATNRQSDIIVTQWCGQRWRVRTPPALQDAPKGLSASAERGGSEGGPRAGGGVGCVSASLRVHVEIIELCISAPGVAFASHSWHTPR